MVAGFTAWRGCRPPAARSTPASVPELVGLVEALAFTQRRVYLGGEFNTVNWEHRTRLAAVSRQGRLQPWSPRANNTVLAMRTADGLVYAGGLFSAINGDPAHGFLVALTPRTGSVSPSFEARLPVPALDFRITDRRVFVGAGGPGGRLTALSRSGAFTWSQTFDGDVAAVQVLGGRIYVGGHWEYICATRRVADTTGDCLSEGEILRPRLGSLPHERCPHSVGPATRLGRGRPGADLGGGSAGGGRSIRHLRRRRGASAEVRAVRAAVTTTPIRSQRHRRSVLEGGLR